MSGAFEKGLHLAVVCGAVALCNAAAGQDATVQSASRPPPSGDDEIIVTWPGSFYSVTYYKPEKILRNFSQSVSLIMMICDFR